MFGNTRNSFNSGSWMCICWTCSVLLSLC